MTTKDTTPAEALSEREAFDKWIAKYVGRECNSEKCVYVWADMLAAWQARGEYERTRPTAQNDAPCVDHRKIGCLIHENLDSAREKHENVIAIYDALKPYFIKDCNDDN